ncbi:11473_t:CDS:2 [Funneliformis geosporum]|nr:11473_t:CDS:2 [Funneliformis geosporum]
MTSSVAKGRALERTLVEDLINEGYEPEWTGGLRHGLVHQRHEVDGEYVTFQNNFDLKEDAAGKAKARKTCLLKEIMSKFVKNERLPKKQRSHKKQYEIGNKQLIKNMRQEPSNEWIMRNINIAQKFREDQHKALENWINLA